MSVRKNKPTERAIKMSDVKVLKRVKCITDEYVYVTKGCVYTVLSTNGEHLRLICDDGDLVTYHKDDFVDVEEIEKEQYVEMSTSLVYEVVYKGDTLAILKGVQDGREITVNVEYLPSTNFVQLTKEMQKQHKKNEDLCVLANVTDEIRKLLDDNHVICHANVNRDTKGLVEFTVMLGESV